MVTSETSYESVFLMKERFADLQTYYGQIMVKKQIKEMSMLGVPIHVMLDLNSQVSEF